MDSATLVLLRNWPVTKDSPKVDGVKLKTEKVLDFRAGWLVSDACMGSEVWTLYIEQVETTRDSS